MELSPSSVSTVEHSEVADRWHRASEVVCRMFSRNVAVDHGLISKHMKDPVKEAQILHSLMILMRLFPGKMIP